MDGLVQCTTVRVNMLIRWMYQLRALVVESLLTGPAVLLFRLLLTALEVEGRNCGLQGTGEYEVRNWVLIEIALGLCTDPTFTILGISR